MDRTEFKWVMITIAIVFTGMFGALAVREYSKGQCLIEGIRAGLTAEMIVKTCGSPR